MDLKSFEFYQELKKLAFIQEIWLFGSRARGDHRERSDIDLAIYAPNASDCDWLKVLDILDDGDTLLKIDCVRMDILDESSALKGAILTQGIKLYERISN
jgi:predicted nucleotidyltransferase